MAWPSPRSSTWPDLVVTLKELAELGIGFVSLTEAFDMTTPTGRALAGMLAAFAEFEREIMRERLKAGIAQARSKGITLGSIDIFTSALGSKLLQ
jgi:DNA invertase Pin-like site-specific DNA recombinase